MTDLKMMAATCTATLAASVVTGVVSNNPAQAQVSIPVTGGSLGCTGGNCNTYAVAFSLDGRWSGTISTNQGNFAFQNVNQAEIQSVGINTFSVVVSGSGFSPSGPVLFSNVPLSLTLTQNVSTLVDVGAGTVATVTGGMFNATGFAMVPQVATPDFSVGQFHFTDPFPAPAAPAPVTPTFETLTASTQNFNIPDPISLQTGEGQAEAIFQAAQQQSLRPNGMHTRIIPAWTPGLYQ